MAKSLRSKAKRHFRLLRRDVVSNHPHLLSQEEKRQASMDAAVAAPTLPVPADKEDGMEAGAGPGPSEAGDMDVDTRGDLPEVTIKNSRKILSKLRIKRSAEAKANPAPKKGKKKVSNLSGASQFHKPKAKRRR